MNVLIIGSGGREHAFAWKIAQSPLCGQLYVAPGNAGTAQVATNVALGDDFAAVADFCHQRQIGLLLVGPEAPLVAGLVDHLRADPRLAPMGIIGPPQAGAQLEGSKDFAKQFMQRHGIPTARYQSFTLATLDQGLAYLGHHPLPVVLKADGLAAGKGVLIVTDHQEARQRLRQMLEEALFGPASATVVVEQFLAGIELSVFVLTDGQHYCILPAAKDYKRVGEGDTGLNTGGMGAVSPVPFADAAFMEKVENRIVKPTLAGLRAEGIPYVGFIFIGLMNVQGEPYVIEYNVRMGDPETEVVVPRLQSDLLELLHLTAQGRLAEATLQVDPRTATTIMLVSGGYPGGFAKGKPMTGWPQLTEVLPFHAGTVAHGDQVLTNGGRVLALTALAPSLPEALARANAAAQTIDFEGKYYRRDIGFDL
ncbi:MAG: phosphoribosylamine--glycine ligase [Bernardetiaceae bacterium]|jgi:phosphoribosylamine--glycine ligase|nr:phosphoribosylamine--glycine ligase [Bernardetiaceae bacterium]